MDTGNISLNGPETIITSDTTGTLLTVTGDALTTGKLGSFISNSADTSVRLMVDVVNDNTAATGTIAMNVRQDADATALRIVPTGNGIGLAILNPANTTANTINVSSADSLTTGSMLNLLSNSADTSARKLIWVKNDHTNATGTYPLWVTQDADNWAHRIDAYSYASYIASTATTQDISRWYGNSLTTGRLALFSSDSPDTSVRRLVHISNTHTDSSQTTGLLISTEGNTGMQIATGANTAWGMQITSSNTTQGGAAYFYSNSPDTSVRRLVQITNDNTAAVGAKCLQITNDAASQTMTVTSNGAAAYGLRLDGSLTTGEHLTVGDNGYLTTGSLAYFGSTSPDTSARNLVNIVNDHTAATGTIPLNIRQDANAKQIACTAGNECLTFAGVWTDRSSTRSEKDNVVPLEPIGYVDKLKNLQMYTYQKKGEVYGVKQEVLEPTAEVMVEGDKEGERVAEDGVDYIAKEGVWQQVVGREYPVEKINPEAKTYVGYLLDDETTPEEIIERDQQGNITGISGTHNANFLMAVVKELIARVEALEAK